MPGPMSIPNGSGKLHKITKGDHVWHRYTQDLTGEERVYLANRRMLDTGKTRKRKEKQ